MLLKLTTEDNSLLFSRGNKLLAENNMITRRELYSTCGSISGHYPIVRWLRVACSSNGEDSKLGWVKEENLVKGYWHIRYLRQKMVSDDVILEVYLLEKISKWMKKLSRIPYGWRKKMTFFIHINVAELEYL